MVIMNEPLLTELQLEILQKIYQQGITRDIIKDNYDLSRFELKRLEREGMKVLLKYYQDNEL